MRGRVLSLSQSDFDAWVKNEQRDATAFSTDDLSLAAEGQQV